MIINILLGVTLTLMVVMAIFTVLSNDLFTAVIYLAVLSFLSAFLYVLLGAPDVALAEAVIGATIVTVIFLITLKNYRIFYIYLMGDSKDIYSTELIHKITRTLRQEHIEVHILRVDKDPKEMLQEHTCDLVVEKNQDRIILHGEKGSQYLAKIGELLEEEIREQIVFIEEN